MSIIYLSELAELGGSNCCFFTDADIFNNCNYCEDVQINRDTFFHRHMVYFIVFAVDLKEAIEKNDLTFSFGTLFCPSLSPSLPNALWTKKSICVQLYWCATHLHDTRKIRLHVDYIVQTNVSFSRSHDIFIFNEILCISESRHCFLNIKNFKSFYKLQVDGSKFVCKQFKDLFFSK